MKWTFSFLGFGFGFIFHSILPGVQVSWATLRYPMATYTRACKYVRFIYLLACSLSSFVQYVSSGGGNSAYAYVVWPGGNMYIPLILSFALFVVLCLVRLGCFFFTAYRKAYWALFKTNNQCLCHQSLRSEPCMKHPHLLFGLLLSPTATALITQPVYRSLCRITK